jgi:hypothetical protein
MLYTVDAEVVKSLVAIDQLKAVVDSHFGWIENFRSVDHQLGSGLSSRPSSGSHLQRKSLSAAAAHYHHKNKNSLLIMKSTMAGLMSHLSGNLA